MRWIAVMGALTIACSGRIQLPENDAVDGVEGPGTGWLPGTDGPGAQDDPGAQSGAGGSDGAAGVSGASAMEPSTRCNGGLAAGPAPMRRLTQSEYNNTVRDLLGDTSALADDFVADGKVGLFENNAYSPMTTILATQYAEAAETLAASAAQNLDTLLPCDPAAAGEDACAREFIAAFGKRAYRRPLAQPEIDRLYGLYSDLRTSADYDFTGGVRVLIQAMLQSPNFVYHVEQGAPNASGAEAVPLTGHELASRLSYLVWGTMPDDDLFAAADAGELGDVDGLRAQLTRMLDDPLADEGSTRFYRQWLGIAKIDRLTKSTELFPEWTDELKAAARLETERFIDHVVWEGDGRLQTLLTAPFSFVDEQLAAVYGVSGVSGSELQRVDLDPAERAGILSHVSVLATNAHSEQTSPVHRGKFVRERLFCHELPSPPPEVDVTPPKADPTLTTRERYARHSSDAYCAGCHRLMDPIGLGFEGYDAVGRVRSEENGLAIDDTGEIVDTADSNGSFEGLIELAERLGESEEVMQCVARHWFGYAVGRGTNFPEDACSIETVGREFAATGGNLREILDAVVASDGFRHRRAIATEACP
jgi:hypothetical protein